MSRHVRLLSIIESLIGILLVFLIKSLPFVLLRVFTSFIWPDNEVPAFQTPVSIIYDMEQSLQVCLCIYMQSYSTTLHMVAVLHQASSGPSCSISGIS